MLEKLNLVVSRIAVIYSSRKPKNNTKKSTCIKEEKVQEPQKPQKCFNYSVRRERERERERKTERERERKKEREREKDRDRKKAENERERERKKKGTDRKKKTRTKSWTHARHG